MIGIVHRRLMEMDKNGNRKRGAQGAPQSIGIVVLVPHVVYLVENIFRNQ